MAAESPARDIRRVESCRLRRARHFDDTAHRRFEGVLADCAVPDAKEVRGVFELDLSGRGDAVDNGHCELYTAMLRFSDHDCRRIRTMPARRTMGQWQAKPDPERDLQRQQRHCDDGTLPLVAPQQPPGDHSSSHEQEQDEEGHRRLDADLLERTSALGGEPEHVQRWPRSRGTRSRRCTADRSRIRAHLTAPLVTGRARWRSSGRESPMPPVVGWSTRRRHAFRPHIPSTRGTCAYASAVVRPACRLLAILLARRYVVMSVGSTDE